jgi:hypothetical protein
MRKASRHCGEKREQRGPIRGGVTPADSAAPHSSDPRPDSSFTWSLLVVQLARRRCWR